MTDITANIIASINDHHAHAMEKAGEAITHAMLAGKLLLKVKASLKHGEFVPWLEKNISVSARQARRYMQIAEGRPLPIRANRDDGPGRGNAVPIENRVSDAPTLADLSLTGEESTDSLKRTPVSILEADAPREFPGDPDHPPQFVPKEGHWCWAVGASGAMAYVVEPSAQYPGYFYVSHLHDDGDNYDCTNRPVRAEWVEFQLQHFGMAAPASAEWHIRRSAGVGKALETLNATEAA